MKLYAKHPNRTRGDQYANRLELLGPPLALLKTMLGVIFVLMALSLFFTQSYGFAAFVTIALVDLFYFSRWNVSRKGDNPLSACGIVAFRTLYLRDIFRGLGLIRGVWWFMILRRGTAP